MFFTVRMSVRMTIAVTIPIPIPIPISVTISVGAHTICQCSWDGNQRFDRHQFTCGKCGICKVIPSFILRTNHEHEINIASYQGNGCRQRRI